MTADAAARSDRWKISGLAALVVVITVLHYGIAPEAGAGHDVLLRAYYVPIVLAGLWFGVRGGLLASAAVSLMFFPHALHGWHAPYTFVFRLIEILMYNVIGGLTGVMSSRTRRALAAEQAARRGREQAYDDLKAKTQLLFEMEEQLRRSERLAALGRMSAGLAHEIRNPLASIKTSVEMLEDRAREEGGAVAPRRLELLQVLAEETDRLNRILTRFLQFARVEGRRDEGALQRCDLGEVAAATVALVRRQLDGAGVRAELEPEELALPVAISEDHLRQVLLNLLLNACEAMSSGGQIRLRLVERTAASVVLAVEDSGPGIPEQVARQIFDPFFSTKEGGVGLGLSIVSRLLEADGGAIELDPTTPTGTRFLVTLPLADG